MTASFLTDRLPIPRDMFMNPQY